MLASSPPSRLCLPAFALASLLLAGAAVTAVAQTFVPGEVIVRYRSGLTPSRQERTKALLPGSRTAHAFAFIDAEHVSVPGLSTEAIITRLRTDPDVLAVEPNYIVTAELIPDDPAFSQLWGLHNTGLGGAYAGDDIDAALAWDLTTGDPGLMVGVIDTGIDYTHPDLAANIWTNPGEIPDNGLDDDNNGYVDDVHGFDVVNGDGDPMDDNSHGTHVAGTIAAVGNNGLGVCGVVWHCRLVAIKFMDAAGMGTEAGAIAGIQYAMALGLRLTNNSWGNMPGGQILLDAINAAGATGQLLVFAAGNNNRNMDLVPYYPGAYLSPHMIKVAATDGRDLRASFSNYGPTTVDLGAPGYGIHSGIPGGLYATYNGTSMAAPHVTGTVALAFSRFPHASVGQVRQLILDSTDPVASMAGITVTGGRLNAYQVLLNGDATAPGAIAGFACVDSNVNALTLHWTAPGDDGLVGTAARYEMRMALSPIDSAGFTLADVVVVPAPQTAGSPEALVIGGLFVDTPHHFALRAVDDFGNPGPLTSLSVTPRAATAVEGAPPALFALRVTSANPGAGVTRFELSLPRDDDVDVTVFDVRGARLRQLAAGRSGAGSRSLSWDGRDDRGRRVPPGVYLVRARTRDGSRVSRITLID